MSSLYIDQHPWFWVIFWFAAAVASLLHFVYRIVQKPGHREKGG